MIQTIKDQFKSHSRFTWWLLSFIFILQINYFNWPNKIISWDNFGYYLYLPQTIIEHDVYISDFDKLDSINKVYDLTPGFYQFHAIENSNHIIQYPIGHALMDMPFFLLAHAYATISDYPTDGYSQPYQFAIVCASIFYTVFGLYLTRKLLLNYFSDKLVAILLVLLFFGTNFLAMHTNSIGVSNNYLFCVFNLFLLRLIKWDASRNFKDAFLLGLVFGLMVLIRPTALFFSLFIITYSVFSIQQLQTRIKSIIFSLQGGVLAMLLGGLTCVLPQLLYWKIGTGNFFYYSYSNPGEGFEFLEPHFFEFLFGFRKGWLIYTPLMILAVVGIFYLKKVQSKWLLSFTILFPVYIYILSSWSNYWYAASFGSRPVTELYGFLLIPLGFFLVAVQSNKIINGIVYLFCLCCIFLNLFQTWQFNQGIISEYRMTYSYYKAAFLKTQKPKDAEKLLLIDRMKVYSEGEKFSDSLNYSMTKHLQLGFETLSKEKAGIFSDSLSHAGKYSFLIKEKDGHCPAIRLRYKDFTNEEHAWLRISMYLWLSDSINRIDPVPYATFLNKREQAYKWKGISLKILEPDFPIKQWKKIYFDYLTPDIRSTNDMFSVAVWKAGKGDLFVDDIEVKIYTLKP